MTTTSHKTNIIVSISLAILMALLLVMAGCSASPTPTPAPTPTPTPTQPTISQPGTPVELNVSAAASLTDVLKEINDLYTQGKPNVTITPNFASSGTLQKQIERGAPADIFIAAAEAQMDILQKEGLALSYTRKDLLNNKLVLIVPFDSTLGLTSFNDLATDKVKKVAIGDPKSVPAGTYAQQAFDLLGITAQLQPKCILAADVRQVLTYVETGNVDAGLVYFTDAKTSSKVNVVATAADSINAKIIYPVAVIKGKNADAARDYENFLFGAQAKAVFEKYGFTMIEK